MGFKTILENREHKKINFRFWGNGGTSLFISGEKGEQVTISHQDQRSLIWYLITASDNKELSFFDVFFSLMDHKVSQVTIFYSS